MQLSAGQTQTGSTPGWTRTNQVMEYEFDYFPARFPGDIKAFPSCYTNETKYCAKAASHSLWI